MCDEFRIAVPRRDGPAPTVKDYLDPLNAFLLQSHAQGRNSVLIIDEAQNLSADVLEQLRLLTNLETSERKLLQIILIGQPELRELLAQPRLEQLAQRVIARYHLDALGRDETEHYVRHRLEVAGLSRALPFERRALERIHRRSGGVPRRINLLCDRALLGAFGRSEPAGHARHRRPGGARGVRRSRAGGAAAQVAPGRPARHRFRGRCRSARRHPVLGRAGAGRCCGARSAVRCRRWPARSRLQSRLRLARRPSSSRSPRSCRHRVR